MELTFTASAVKSWFQYRCERKLVYETMAPEVRGEIPILRASGPTPWADFGNLFEERLVSKLAEQRTVLRPDPGKDCISGQLSAAFLRRQRPEAYAHQLLLTETPSLRDLLGLTSRPSVRIKSGRPDLVEAADREGLPELSIIDIKATQNATLFHKAQVAFYALMIRGILREQGSNVAIAPEGQIWHLPPGGLTPSVEWLVERFPLRSYEALVIDFFKRQVPQIAEKEVTRGQDTTFFHIYFKCEQCPFLVHCEREISADRPADQRDVSAVPGVSHESKRVLRDLGIRTVGALRNAEGLRALTQAPSWALQSRSDLLVSRAKAIVDGTTRRHADRFSWLMPPAVDVGIYVVVDVDPVEGNLITIGCMRDQAGRAPEFVVRAIPKSTPAAELSALRDVLGKVLETLTEIDAHNASSPTNPLHTHIFLYEPSEGKDLQEALGRHLNDPQVRSQLLELIRIFPPQEVLPEPEYKGMHHLPATALRSVVEEMFALPVQVSNDLERVSQALAQAPTPIAQPYTPAGAPFARRFSSRLSIEACRGLREQKLEPEVVVKNVRDRLLTLAALARWLEEENRRAEAPFLRLRKQPFRFQTTIDPLNARELDVLLAQELLDNRASFLSHLVELALPAKQRRDRFRCLANLKLRKWGEKPRGFWMRFTVPPESRQAEISSSTIFTILTDDDPDVRLDPRLWDAFRVRIMADENETTADSIGVFVAKDVFRSERFQRLVQRPSDSPWFIDEVHADYNTAKIVDFIRYLAEGPEARS